MSAEPVYVTYIAVKTRGIKMTNIKTKKQIQ